MSDKKKLLGVLTMAYQDYFFVERWYRYWSSQIGAENIYLLSHGNDPMHREIAQGANILNLPREEGMFKFDRRRWKAMSFISSGLLEFYKWMIVSDVDEIVIADPCSAPSVSDWLTMKAGSGKDTLLNISPLCLELIHLPQEEPERIVSDATILSRRRIFRPNRNYSKPCIVGAPVIFGPGGHRNNLGPRYLPDDVYTLHLKFFDYEKLAETAEGRKKIVNEAEKAGSRTLQGWQRTMDNYRDIVASMTLSDETIELHQYRAAMRKQRLKYSNNQYEWGKAYNDKLYRLPERFSTVF